MIVIMAGVERNEARVLFTKHLKTNKVSVFDE